MPEVLEASPKRVIRWAGHPPKITEEQAERVGERVGKGMKPEFALAREYPPISMEHWLKTVQKSTRIASAYIARVSLEVEELVKLVDPAVKGWQAAAWKLERVHGYINKMLGGTQVNVQVNTCIGLSDDIAKRARAFVGSNETANERRRLKDK